MVPGVPVTSALGAGEQKDLQNWTAKMGPQSSMVSQPSWNFRFSERLSLKENMAHNDRRQLASSCDLCTVCVAAHTYSHALYM